MSILGYFFNTISLDLDPSHWGLSDSEAQNRRALYWESILVEHWIVGSSSFSNKSQYKLTCNVWQAIAYGRPSGFDVTFADCRFAHDMEPSFLESGESELGCEPHSQIIVNILSNIIILSQSLQSSYLCLFHFTDCRAYIFHTTHKLLRIITYRTEFPGI